MHRNWRDAPGWRGFRHELARLTRAGNITSILLGCLLACAPAAVRAAEPYTVYGILSLTGSGAFLGNEQERTLGAIETLTNEQGGINGTPIHFAIADDTSNPTVAVQLANNIIAKHVPAMLGPTIVASCKAVAPLFKNGPVQYCFAPGIYPPAGSFVFAAGVSTRNFAIAALDYFRKKGWTRIAIIASSDATGQEGERVIRDALARPENHNVKLVAVEHFSITDLSIDAQMAHIQAANPQVIIAWTVGTPFATVLRSYSHAGLTVPVATNSGNIVRVQMDQYAAFAPKDLYFTATRYLAYNAAAVADPVSVAQRTFFNTIKKVGIDPDTGPEIAWDTGSIIVDALRHLGVGTSAAALHAYLEKLHGYAGISGIFDFRSGNQRGLGLSSAIIVRWDAAKKKFLAVSAPGGTPLP